MKIRIQFTTIFLDHGAPSELPLKSQIGIALPAFKLDFPKFPGL